MNAAPSSSALVTAETRDTFRRLATAWQCSIADAIERTAAQAIKKIPKP